MPFAKSFHSDMDAVYPVSEDGRCYLLEQYRIPEAKVRVARLGVRDPGTIARDGARTGTFRVLSISYAKPVKRLHRIVGGLVALRARYPDIDVLWTHIGDGPELVKLKSLASQYGVEADFLGQLKNRQVLDYLAEAEIDAFINVSASEGVPVSIMEALSFGVPVLATDVGGTREIVEDRVGRLLPAEFSDDEFVQALIAVKDIKDRTLIRAHFYEVCAAESVFPRFVEEVLGSGAHETSPLRREI
jgi:glycosyltransferase involved in cell wall biosynthesis